MMIRDEVLWFDHALVPIADTEGRVASVLGVSRDITKRINAEREVRENEQNYRFIAEHSVDIINRQTPECICTYTSPSVTTLLGYTEREVLGRSDACAGTSRRSSRCNEGYRDDPPPRPYGYHIGFPVPAQGWELPLV